MASTIAASRLRRRAERQGQSASPPTNNSVPPELAAGLAGGLLGGLMGAMQAAETAAAQQRQRRAEGVPANDRQQMDALSSILGGAMQGAAIGAALGGAISVAASSQQQQTPNAQAQGAGRAGRTSRGSRSPQAQGETSLDDLWQLFQEMYSAPARAPPRATAAAAAAAAGPDAGGGSGSDGNGDGGDGSGDGDGGGGGISRGGSTRSLTELFEALEALRVAVRGGGAPVPPTASQAAIARLPEHAYVQGVEVVGGVEEDGETTCCICLDVLRDGDMLKTLPCSHCCFHSQCIDHWLGRGAGVCPVCRSEVI